MIEDFMFHWIIRKGIEYNLPIQVHTGFQAGNGNTLENSHPNKLNNLFLKYPEAKFVLFHGGFPWTGEYIALAKMFPNVYLDIVWLPQISRQSAMQTFHQMLDCVPHNKFFWGGDCATIEESTGALEYSKDIVAQVLANRVESKLLTEEVAIDIARGIFRNNAIILFKLEKKLGRTF
jgi:predicted TIM-barrel fold metal-dependent hydrolase